MNESITKVFSTEETCKILKIGKNRLYFLLKSGILKGYREGNRWKISEQAIAEYISRQSRL